MVTVKKLYRIIIEKIGTRVLTTRIITGPKDKIGKRYFVHRIDLKTKPKKYDFELNRFQFPVRLAYAMTINKSQGQTLTKVGLYLPEAVFAHGQLYVALSRVGDDKQIQILIKDTKKQRNIDGCVYTRNVVHREVLDV